MFEGSETARKPQIFNYTTLCSFSRIWIFSIGFFCTTSNFLPPHTLAKVKIVF